MEKQDLKSLLENIRNILMEGPPGWTAEHPEGWDPTEWMYDPLKPYIPPRPEGWVGPWPFEGWEDIIPPSSRPEWDGRIPIHNPIYWDADDTPPTQEEIERYFTDSVKLKNIHSTLIEEGEWHSPLLAPEENPNWSPLQPPPWLSPLSPTGPITPTLVDPENPFWTPEMEQYFLDRTRPPSEWLRIRGFPPAGVPDLPDGFPTGAQEWYQNLTPEQQQLLSDWVNQHFGMLELLKHNKFFQEVLRGKHSQQELLKWLKENWPELYQP